MYVSFTYPLHVLFFFSLYAYASYAWEIHEHVTCKRNFIIAQPNLNLSAHKQIAHI